MILKWYKGLKLKLFSKLSESKTEELSMQKLEAKFENKRDI